MLKSEKRTHYCEFPSVTFKRYLEHACSLKFSVLYWTERFLFRKGFSAKNISCSFLNY